MTGSRILVEVAYADPAKQFLVELKLTAPVTVEEAIKKSGVLEAFPQLDLDTASVGIFSRPAELETLLGEGDRVEVYRPLQVDPKEARRLRAAAKKKQQAG